MPCLPLLTLAQAPLADPGPQPAPHLEPHNARSNAPHPQALWHPVTHHWLCDQQQLLSNAGVGRNEGAKEVGGLALAWLLGCLLRS